MADIKISALPTATTPLTGAELVPIVQGAVTKQTTTSDLLAVPVTSLTASSAVATDASKKLVSVANTGTGDNVLANGPTLVAPALGTPASGNLLNAIGLPIATGVSGLGTGVATALAVNVGTAGSPVVNGGALGTPASGTVTNLTGTASININGTVGATTPAAVSATALSYSTTLTGGTGIVNLGSGQFYKDASGNVGIGTSSPAQIVEANKSQDAKTQIKTTNTNAGVSASAGVLFGTSSGDNGYVGANGGAASSALGGANALQITNLSAAPIVLATNGIVKLVVASGGDVTVSTAALLGYGTGSGGTVTQATSKATAVTLNKPTGQININASSLAADTSTTFQLNNSLISGTDVLTMALLYGYGTAGAYVLSAQMGTGQAQISIRNVTAGALAEQLYIQFAIIKGATS